MATKKSTDLPENDTIDGQGEPDLPPPADFDVNAWVKGVRSTVRAVTLYQRADLLAEIEDLGRRLEIEQRAAEDEDSLDGNQANELAEQLEELYAEFVASGVTWKVEARSADWLTNVEKQVNKHRDSNGLSKEARAELVTATQLADAVIQPTGVTIEHLETLREVSDAQYRRLVAAFLAACSQAPGVSVPFSQRPSGKNGGRR